MIAALNPVAPAGIEIEVAPPAAPPLGASAALVAMVEEWRSLLDQLGNDSTSDEAVVSLGDQHNALQHAIYDFPAASVADLLAKEPVFRCEMQDAVSGLADGFEPAETLAGAAWLGLFRDFERLARRSAIAALSEGPAPDPVFALIAEHQAAFAEWDRLSEVWSTMDPSASGYAEAQAASDLPGRCEVAAYDALFSCAPTTLPGTLALAEYLGAAVRRVRIDPEASAGELALGAVTAALRGLMPAAKPILFDDTALSIAALAALYDAARGAAEHLDALGGGPGDPERVGVRAVLGGEAERLRGVMLACADALAEREPRTPAERRARARVRAMHAVEVGAWADLAGFAIAEGSADAEGGR